MIMAMIIMMVMLKGISKKLILNYVQKVVLLCSEDAATVKPTSQIPTIMEIIIKIECQEYCLACQKNVSNWAKIREKPVKERRSGSHLAKLTIANKYLVKNSILSRSRTRLYLVDVSVSIVVVGVLALLTMVRLVAAACMLFICFNFKRHLAISWSVFPSFVQWWLVAAQTVSPQIHIIHYKTLKNT